MSLTCDAEISGNINNSLALRFSTFTDPVPIIEYIKTISSLIGASHILAVFEENDTIKMFFDDKRFIDLLMSKPGIHVMGHHVRVDYVVPPGVKVVLSNIDPVISNTEVVRILSMYGNLVSPIIRPPICDDVELCHIGYGVRYLYMHLNAPIPNKIVYDFGGQSCIIKARTGDSLSLLPSIKQDMDAENITTNPVVIVSPSGSSSSNDYNFRSSDIPVVVSVQSAVSESTSEEQPQNNLLNSDDIPVRRRGRRAKALHLKRKKITATSQAAKRITRNVKQKWGSKKMKPFKKGRPGRKRVKQPPVLEPLSSTSSSDADISIPPLLLGDENSPPKSSIKIVLDEESLKMFLGEAKHHRTPFDLLMKYLGTNCNTTAINDFIDQLIVFNSKHSCQSLKLRIARLVKSIRDTLNNQNIQK